ncbi:MAG: dihydrofolate reductase [Leptolyngbyaceae cyanobacterium RU_5_1]|nr:dihydrofolate reductase [Leptolyngbyaceae cyanobacterium RU_5_1]
MPEVVLYIAASLDGYIATPDGGVKWLAAFENSGEDYGYSTFYESFDAVLMGSRTYQQLPELGEWSFTGKPCWVFSRRPLKVEQPEVTLTTQSPHEVMSELAARNLQRAWLLGGAELVASFRAQGLITEYVVSIIPVILGAGIPLFISPGPTEDLKLVESTPYPSGLVQLRYLPGKDDTDCRL